ncbi:MAG: VOC family protein [Rhizobiaceae bacterium]
MISGLNHITLTVSNLGRSFEFYSKTLEFLPVARWKNGAYFESEGLWLALLVGETTGTEEQQDYSHIAFSCDQKNFKLLKSRLAAEGFPAWQENKSEGDSYYFCDPDGHKLEIHVGDLKSRVASMKNKPWADFTFYR